MNHVSNYSVKLCCFVLNVFRSWLHHLHLSHFLLLIQWTQHQSGYDQFFRHTSSASNIKLLRTCFVSDAHVVLFNSRWDQVRRIHLILLKKPTRHPHQAQLHLIQQGVLNPVRQAFRLVYHQTMLEIRFLLQMV